jgi:modification methylase
LRRVKGHVCESIAEYVPREIGHLDNPQKAIPQIAKNEDLVCAIEAAVRRIPTSHELHQADARAAKFKPGSVHLIVTSPPYWTLKEYRPSPGQMGHIANYEEFLRELDKVLQR